MSLPYDYYPLVLHALNLFSQGRTISDACDEANIEVATFRRYVDADAILKDMYVDAEQRSFDAMADALINIDNHKLHGQTNPQMAKVISDNIKWVLAKRDNKRFGEKIEVKHEVTMDRAIIDALNASRARTSLPSMDTIEDAEVIEDDAELLRQLLS